MDRDEKISILNQIKDKYPSLFIDKYSELRFKDYHRWGICAIIEGTLYVAPYLKFNPDDGFDVRANSTSRLSINSYLDYKKYDLKKDSWAKITKQLNTIMKQYKKIKIKMKLNDMNEDFKV